MNRFLLWIAQGFGIGRIPVAPGTFGSVLGVFWFALLLLPGKLWVLIAGCIVGVAFSIWACGSAEKTLGRSDPGSVVLDEIAAIPICFLGWSLIQIEITGTLPSAAFLFLHPGWVVTLSIFAAFRFFDIVKPWPVNRSQSLHGGIGVTADDVLAAGYVNLVVLALWGATRMGWFGR